MAEQHTINTKSLKTQVYEYLREEIRKQTIRPGSMINMDSTSKKLGISKTPLRDALIQLEMEGFVTIAPRKGIFVNRLNLREIKEFYQVIGALEQSALHQAFNQITASDIEKMKKLNEDMRGAIGKDNFDLFYQKNLAFHNTYIDRSQNQTLIRIIDNLKKRLYDFPRQEKWIKEWEESSILEHQRLVELIERRQLQAAVNYIHDVHWSFRVQEQFIMRYYFPSKN